MAIDTADIKVLIAETIQNILIEKLEQQSIAFQLGATVFNTSNPISVPKRLGNYSPDWVGENEEIAEDDGVTFDNVKLLPSTMKSVKSLLRLSNESLRQSSQNLAAILQGQLLTDVATKVDAQFFSNLGDGITTPEGLLKWAGTTKLQLTETSFSVDSLLAARATALAGHIQPGSLTWVMSPKVFSDLAALKYDDGRYVLQTDLTADAGYRLLGSNVKLTDRLTDNTIAVADWSAVAVAQDSSPSTVVDTSRYLEYDQTAIRVTSRYDFKPTSPEKIILVNKSA